MLTRALRLLLAHSIRPFTLRPEPKPQPSFLPGPLGLYVHVPFCRTICDFCPYFKKPYSKPGMDSYVDTVLREIQFERGRFTSDVPPIASIYVGGGTPALAGEHLERITSALTSSFGPAASAGIELHPDNLAEPVLEVIQSARFDRVSVGIQSFDKQLLSGIGRDVSTIERRFSKLSGIGLNVLDVDLIFGLPGQTADALETDFRTAVDLGATQISTYPFISFSYAGRRYGRVTAEVQRTMLARLEEVQYDLGWKRTSIWTFAAPGTGRYSSITRDNFIGFGPSAASLLKDAFTINTFSLDEYNRTAGTPDTRSLVMRFTPRTRALYWLFWAWYGLRISAGEFMRLFGKELSAAFGTALRLAHRAGLLRPVADGYVPTPRGALFYHHAEQHYTRQYIDKTWRFCNREPWPKRIRLY